MEQSAQPSVALPSKIAIHSNGLRTFAEGLSSFEYSNAEIVEEISLTAKQAEILKDHITNDKLIEETLTADAVDNKL